MDTNYKYLFVFNKECEGYNLYWTMVGNYDENSIKYRLPNSKMRIKYGTTTFNEIGVIECKDYEDAVNLQRSMNELFKLWHTENAIIKINMKPETFIEYLNVIYKVMNDNNKMLQLFNLAASKYERYNKYSGYVYFIKCANNKLKIGETGDINYRWHCLKLEDQNQATDIITAISVSDRKFVEAELHLLCRDYKTDGNKLRTDTKSSAKLSELFINCEEVINIWNNYWESYKGFNKEITEEYLNYLRTGKWVE